MTMFFKSFRKVIACLVLTAVFSCAIFGCGQEKAVRIYAGAACLRLYVFRRRALRVVFAAQRAAAGLLQRQRRQPEAQISVLRFLPGASGDLISDLSVFIGNLNLSPI